MYELYLLIILFLLNYFSNTLNLIYLLLKIRLFLIYYQKTYLSIIL